MAFFLPLLFIFSPAYAEHVKNPCDDQKDSIHLKQCAMQKLKESNKALSKELTPETFNRWISIADEVCQETYALYRKGSIYPLVVINCQKDLNQWVSCRFNKGLKGGCSD